MFSKLHIDLFWSKVFRSDKDSCWLWLGAENGRGYGHLRILGLDYTAHRFSYEIHYGPISHKDQILHTCDERSCVNPAHLFAGSIKDNMEDMKMKDRSNKGSRNSGSKLTEDIVIKIRRSDESNKSLSSRYGVTERRIRDVRRKVIWTHI